MWDISSKDTALNVTYKHINFTATLIQCKEIYISSKGTTLNVTDKHIYCNTDTYSGKSRIYQASE